VILVVKPAHPYILKSAETAKLRIQRAGWLGKSRYGIRVTEIRKA